MANIIKWPHQKNPGENEPRVCIPKKKSYAAMRFDGDNQEVIKDWIDCLTGGRLMVTYQKTSITLSNTRNQSTFLTIGDYLLHNQDTGFYIVQANRFDDSYEWKEENHEYP